MSRAKQLGFNLRCILWDVVLGEWRRVRFHWAGVRRALR